MVHHFSLIVLAIHALSDNAIARLFGWPEKGRKSKKKISREFSQFISQDCILRGVNYKIHAMKNIKNKERKKKRERR